MLFKEPQPYPPAVRNFREHDIDTAVDIPAIPKINQWTPPPYWQNLLSDDKKIEIRGFRFIVVGFALFGVIIAVVFFWKIIVAVLAMRIILS